MTSRTRSRPLHIALEIDGTSTANPGADPLSPRDLAEVVAGVERAGVTLATFDDSPLPPDGGHRLDATTRAVYVATLTDRIGLAPASHVTTAEPFHLAAQLAGLEHATHGRAAWLVGATARPEALATVGRPPLGSDALRQEVADVVEVVRRLWDSWEDDAVIKDVETGRYLDPGKVHHVDFDGETFSVKGPLITPRPPQGSLVALAPDTLDDAARPDVALVADKPGSAAAVTTVIRADPRRSTSHPSAAHSMS
ncbi:LLM class flavin-dependent oxidoreductase [Amycolatopsis sp. NPDC005232]|uniref:LLM class flavin-dependent oxidoreductase n=1 Tax=Amycolatopsis sp. NPDC005232 TaxID=3157027 RepID=UPI0033B680CE